MPFTIHPYQHPRPLETIDLLSIIVVLPLRKLAHKWNEVVCSLRVWQLSLSAMCLRFTRVVVCTSNHSFHSWVVFHYTNVPHFVYVLPSWDTFGLFLAWGDYEWIKPVWTFTYRFLGEHRFSFHLGKYQGEELLDLTVRVYLTLQETAKLFSKVSGPFCIIPAIAPIFDNVSLCLF